MAVWGVMIASTLAFSPPRQNSDEIELEIHAGYDNYYRAGKWIPVQVTVRNSGADIRGTLQIRTHDVSENTEALYQTPITVARNTPKTAFIYISVESGQPEIEIELLDRQGRVLKAETQNLTQVNARDILYVVVTESTQGLVDVTRRPIGGGQRYQINWGIADLPGQPEALRAIDVMVFFDWRNGRLTPEQQNALQVWVHNGGHLIVHGGPRPEYAQNYLDALMPVDIAGTDTVSSLTALGTFLGRPSDLLTSSENGFVVSRTTPRDGAEVMLEIEDKPIIIRKTFGGGVVDYVALDPLSAPLNSYTDTDGIWLELVTSAEPRPSWGYDFENWLSANDAVRVVTGVNLPSVLQMLGFLGIYIALIGPVNYVVLRQFRRRELAWVTIPALIVIFTLVAYYTGFSLRGNAATVNHLSVVQVWTDSDIARVDGLVGVFSPRRTTYDLLVDSNMTLRTIPGIKDVDTGIAQIPVIQDGNFRIEELPVDAGIIASFATSGYAPAPHIDASATWILNDTPSPSLSGTITNNETFTLNDVVILAKDGFYPVGTLEPGESRKFDFINEFRIVVQEPTWLPLGNRRDISSNIPFRMPRGRPGRDLVSPLTNLQDMNSLYECTTGRYNATMVEVMYDQFYDCSERGGTDDERRTRRRALLLGAISNEFDYSGGRASNVYAMGWAETAPFEVELQGTSQQTQYESLYIFELPVSFERDLDVDQPIMIPPGLMTMTLVDSTGFTIDRSPYNLQPLVAPDQLIFRFALVSDLATVKINQLHIEATMAGSSFQSLSLALWDWRQGVWIPLEYDDFELQTNNATWIMVLDAPESYLGPTNAILLQVQPADNSDEVQIEAIEPRMFIQ